MVAEISSAQLCMVVDEIFGAMAGLHLQATSSPTDPSAAGGVVVSTVQIVGDWQGAVRLDIGLPLARHVCANLVGVDPDQLSPPDIRDAAGELANMTAGSVKRLCAPNSRLSLPSVVMGRDFEFSVAQGTIIQAASFEHSSGQLTVSVIEKESPGQQ